MSPKNILDSRSHPSTSVILEGRKPAILPIWNCASSKSNTRPWILPCFLCWAESCAEPSSVHGWHRAVPNPWDPTVAAWAGPAAALSRGQAVTAAVGWDSGDSPASPGWGGELGCCCVRTVTCPLPEPMASGHSPHSPALCRAGLGVPSLQVQGTALPARGCWWWQQFLLHITFDYQFSYDWRVQILWRMFLHT